MDSYVNEISKMSNSNDLVESNLKFVMKIAHEYSNMGLPLEDLVQEGNIGLIEASKKFDASRGNKFITYAVHYIRKHIKKALTKNNNIIHQPNHVINNNNKIKKFVGKHIAEKGREPTVKEISKNLKLSEKTIKNINSNKINGYISINSAINDESDDTFEKIISVDNVFDGPDESVIKNERHDHLKKMLSKLNEDDQKLINMRYYENKTLRQIGEELNLSPASVKSKVDKIIDNFKTQSLKKFS